MAISPSRTEEENDALRRKQEQIAKLREKANKPRSLIDESELSRHPRRRRTNTAREAAAIWGDGKRRVSRAVRTRSHGAYRHRRNGLQVTSAASTVGTGTIDISRASMS